MFLFSEDFFEFRFQFFQVVRHSDDVAVAVNEEEGAVLCAVLFEHFELIVDVNESRPVKGMTLDSSPHGIGGLELVGEAEHVQAPVSVLFIKRDDVASFANAGRAPRCPADNERQLILVVIRSTDFLPVHCAHIIVAVLVAVNLIAHSLLLGDTLMHWVVRIERRIVLVIDVKHRGEASVIVVKTIKPTAKLKQEAEHWMADVIVEFPLPILMFQLLPRYIVVLVQSVVSRLPFLFGSFLHSVPCLKLLS